MKQKVKCEYKNKLHNWISQEESEESFQKILIQSLSILLNIYYFYTFYLLTPFILTNKYFRKEMSETQNYSYNTLFHNSSFVRTITKSDIDLQKIYQNQFNCRQLEQLSQSLLVALASGYIYFSQDGYRYYGIQLCYELKFALLYSDESNIMSPPKGFHLKNTQSGLDLTLSSQNVEIIHVWIKQLTKKINRIGFKEFFIPVQRVGKGSCGIVFEVADKIDGKRYAAKAFSKANLHKEHRSMKGLLNQIEILRKLNHKNVIKLYGVYESQNTIYILQELLKGGNLLQRLSRSDENSKMTKQMQSETMEKLLNALTYLHDIGIVHRDIKLENIMFKNLKTIQPVIIDFGFSVYLEPIETIQQIEQIQDRKQNSDLIFPNCGTPGYLAPQLCQKSNSSKTISDITPKSDIFSLGVSFYMMLTKKPLFVGTTAMEVLQKNREMQFQIEGNLQQDAFNLISQMLEKNPDKRISAYQALRQPYFVNKNLEQILLKKNSTSFQQKILIKK